MAKKNINKKVIQMPTSTEGLIKSRARKLPLHECYITAEWMDAHEANIIISRKHVTGNITFGIFLVDLALLGVRDVLYTFNETEYRFRKMIEDINNNPEGQLSLVDYNLVHNIIYGAVEFAEDYGFKPHKSFNTGQYILEADTEEIPLMEIEYGINGMPAVFTSPEKPMLKEISLLEKTAGPGNYKIFHWDDDNDDHFDLDESDENEFHFLPGWDDDIEEMGVPDWTEKDWEKFFKQKPEKLSFRVLQYFTDMMSYELYLDKDLDAFEFILGDAECDANHDDQYSEEENRVIDKFNRVLSEGDFIKASQIIKKATLKFPDSVRIQMINMANKIYLKSDQEAAEEYEAMYKKFPDDLQVKCTYAANLIYNGKYEKLPEIFEGKFTLKELYPDKKNFIEIDVALFCSLFLDYFLYKDDLKKAEPYYQVLDSLEGEYQPFMKNLIQEMVIKKSAFISKMGN